MVRQCNVLSGTGPFEQCKVGRRIRADLKTMGQCEPIGIDQGGRCFDECEGIFEFRLIRLLVHTELFDPIYAEGEMFLPAVRFREWMAGFEEAALKSTIGRKGSVEDPAPGWILQVTINRATDLDRERAAYVVALDEASGSKKFGETVAHTVGEGCHADHGGKL